MLKKKYYNLCHKVWLKTSISLPLWRHLYKKNIEKLQAQLDWQHGIRDMLNETYGTDYTTLQAFMAREARKEKRYDRYPLITPELKEYFGAGL